MSRIPRVGDMLVAYTDGRRNDTHSTRRDNAVGLISKIVEDKYGFQNSVFVAWQGHEPDGYNDEYGYAGLNIMNMTRVFRIFRNGQEIK